MESIAVVKRRGNDIWPCIPGFGGPFCRVGGKLHSSGFAGRPNSKGPLYKGPQRRGGWRECEKFRLTCVICRHLFEPHELTNAYACSYLCLACAEETDRIMNDDEWWAKNGPKEP